MKREIEDSKLIEAFEKWNIDNGPQFKRIGELARQALSTRQGEGALEKASKMGADRIQAAWINAVEEIVQSGKYKEIPEWAQELGELMTKDGTVENLVAELKDRIAALSAAEPRECEPCPNCYGKGEMEMSTGGMEHCRVCNGQGRLKAPAQPREGVPRQEWRPKTMTPEGQNPPLETKPLVDTPAQPREGDCGGYEDGHFSDCSIKPDAQSSQPSAVVDADKKKGQNKLATDWP